MPVWLVRKFRYFDIYHYRRDMFVCRRQQHSMRNDLGPERECDARRQHRRQRVHGGEGRSCRASFPRTAALLQHAVPAQPPAAGAWQERAQWQVACYLFYKVKRFPSHRFCAGDAIKHPDPKQTTIIHAAMFSVAHFLHPRETRWDGLRTTSLPFWCKHRLSIAVPRVGFLVWSKYQERHSFVFGPGLFWRHF